MLKYLFVKMYVIGFVLFFGGIFFIYMLFNGININEL